MPVEQLSQLVSAYDQAADRHNALYPVLPLNLDKFDVTLKAEKEAAQRIIGLGVEGLADLYGLLVEGKGTKTGVENPFLFSRFYTAIALQNATLEDPRKIESVYRVGLNALRNSSIIGQPVRDNSAAQTVCQTMMIINGIIRSSQGYFRNRCRI